MTKSKKTYGLYACCGGNGKLLKTSTNKQKLLNLRKTYLKHAVSENDKKICLLI